MTRTATIEAPDDTTVEPTIDRDLVRSYFEEIARVRLLDARQESPSGLRIEEGRAAITGNLVAIPMARRALLDAIGEARRGERPIEEVLVLPEGGDPTAKDLRAAARLLTRVSRGRDVRARASI